ncbi:MAG: response regulator [Bacteroidia bacterium]
MKSISSVLIIDNNEIDTFVSTKILKEIGVKKIKAIKSVTEAIQYLSSTSVKYELILVELNLPVKNGFDFISEFIELDLKDKQSQIVLISAFFSPNDIENITSFKLRSTLKPITINFLNNF